MTSLPELVSRNIGDDPLERWRRWLEHSSAVLRARYMSEITGMEYVVRLRPWHQRRPGTLYQVTRATPEHPVSVTWYDV